MERIRNRGLEIIVGLALSFGLIGAASRQQRLRQRLVADHEFGVERDG